MLSQQPPQVPQAPVQEFPHEMPAQQMAQPQAGYGYEYSEQYIGAMAQRIAPYVAAILKNQSPIPAPGQRLALAIVSLALLIPLIAIVVGSTPIMATGVIGWLIAVGLICVTMMVVNIVFNGSSFTRS